MLKKILNIQFKSNLRFREKKKVLKIPVSIIPNFQEAIINPSSVNPNYSKENFPSEAVRKMIAERLETKYGNTVEQISGYATHQGIKIFIRSLFRGLGMSKQEIRIMRDFLETKVFMT